ncbi:hypothetical protein FHR70_000688 [Microvirga lupini]|uniref:Uncharacterized protein n=1 Tax=Microvirga lupini TaxID=420324 RepID=A0A7W4YW49_9HYPH|nr:hypothetical protein [Microvirga lupini]MBB3017648.1 hypothetical protein [Microvirga lupini]
MNENYTHTELVELAAIQKRAEKRLRKSVRKLIRADLQRRAITGEPSQFKRAAYGAQL